MMLTHFKWVAAVRWVTAAGAVALALSATARAQLGVNTPPVAWEPGAERQVGPIRIVPIRKNVFMLSSADGNSTVQVGSEGVVVVDTMSTAMAPALLAAIRTISSSPIVQIIDTSFDQTGGNAVLGDAGRNPSVEGGHASILAFETVLSQIADRPAAFWPTTSFFMGTKDLYLNGEAIYMYHQPAAHSDSDLIVLFRSSDVLSVGRVFEQDRYPRFSKGGSLEGLLTSVNRILELAVPQLKEEGGTMIVPAVGRVCDEADVSEYRDMLTIVRDRLRDSFSKRMTLEQVLASKPTRDYDPIYSTPQYSGDMFVEAAYRSMTEATQKTASPQKGSAPQRNAGPPKGAGR